MSENTEKLQLSAQHENELSGAEELLSQKSQEAVLHEQPYFDRFLNYFLPAEKPSENKEAHSPRAAEEQKSPESGQMP